MSIVGNLGSILLNLIDLYAPVQITNHKPKPKWFNSSVFKAIRQKLKAWNTHKATKSPFNFITYTNYGNAATAALRKAKSTFEINFANNVKHNASLFWKYVRDCTRVHHDVGILLQDYGSFTHSQGRSQRFSRSGFGLTTFY